MTYKAKYPSNRKNVSNDTWCVQMSKEQQVTLNCDLIMNQNDFDDLTAKLAEFLRQNNIGYKINMNQSSVA